MRKTSILIIILMVLSTFGTFRQIFLIVARLINLIGENGVLIYDGVFAYNIYTYSLSEFLNIIQNITTWLCVIVFGTILIKKSSNEKEQNIEATIRAKIELKKEEIKTRKVERLAERHANQKAKLQRKLEKLNTESDE